MHFAVGVCFVAGPSLHGPLWGLAPLFSTLDMHTYLTDKVRPMHGYPSESWFCHRCVPPDFLRDLISIHVLHCCCSVAQLCPTLCDPTDCSTPGFPIHYLLVLPGQHLILRAPMVVPSWLFVLISADIYSLSFSVSLYTQEFT